MNTAPSQSAISSSKLRYAFCGLLLAEGAALIAASLLIASVNIPMSRIRIESEIVMGIGAVLAVLSLLTWRLPVQLAMSVAIPTLLLTVPFAIGYHPVQKGDLTLLLGIRTWQSDTEWTERNTESDAQVGWKAIPNSVARQLTRDFMVTYRADAEGWRRLPSPAPGKEVGNVWFTGCSFTFGAGVEDEELYVYRLASTAWPNVRVRNFSYSGWGTTNAYLALQEQFAKRPKPDVVLYGMIGHHSKRNYLRKSWFGTSQAAMIPHFEIESGQLLWKGWALGSLANLPDSPELDQKEFEITVALIRAMASLSRQHGVPFVVLALHHDDERVLDAVRGEPGLHILDVSKLSTSYHPHDGHPTRVWHQAVARGIASNPLLAKLTGIRQLYAPDAISDPPMRQWQLSRDAKLDGKSYAIADYPSAPSEPLKVRFWGEPVDDPWRIYLRRPGVDVIEGRHYLFQMRIRSSGSRTVGYVVSRGGPPWGNLGLEAGVTLVPEWRDVSRVFVATGTDHNAQIMILMGGDQQPVELDGEPILRPLAPEEVAAYKEVLGHKRWFLSARSDVNAVLDQYSDFIEQPLHVRLIKVIPSSPWLVQLAHDGIALQAGREYVAEMRIRASAPRKVEYGIGLDHAPWTNLGLSGEAQLTPAWQTIRKSFVATQDERNARIVLALGGSSEAVEVASFRLLDGEKDMLSDGSLEKLALKK